MKKIIFIMLLAFSLYSQESSLSTQEGKVYNMILSLKRRGLHGDVRDLVIKECLFKDFAEIKKENKIDFSGYAAFMKDHIFYQSDFEEVQRSVLNQIDTLKTQNDASSIIDLAYLFYNIKKIKPLNDFLDLNSTNEIDSLFVKAVENGFINVIDSLMEIDKQINVDLIETNTDETPLVIAAGLGDVGMVNKLLEYGADIDSHSHWGDTALIHAIECGDIDMINALIEGGADVNSESYSTDKSPLDYTDPDHNEIDIEIRRILINAGAVSNETDSLSDIDAEYSNECGNNPNHDSNIESDDGNIYYSSDDS